MLYLTLFNTGSPGKFILTYSYTDNDSADAGSLYNFAFSIEAVPELNKEDADMTLIYFAAIVVGILIVIISFFVLIHYRNEKRENEMAIA